MFGAAPAVALALRLIVEGSCPSTAAVTACLAPLLPSDLTISSQPSRTGDPAREPDFRASVEPLDELLRVQVRDGSGRLLSHNDLPRSATCDGLAAAAAIVIFTAVTAQPRVSPPALSIPPPPVATAPPPPRPRVTLGIGLAGQVALTAASAAVGGWLDVQLATPQDSWGGRLLVGGHGTRTLPLASGAAEWTRLPLALLARRRSHVRPYHLVLDGAAGLFGAAVLVRGAGLAEDYGSLDFDLGPGAGLRVGRVIDLPSGQLLASLEILAVGWLRRQDLRLLGEAQPVKSLPGWDILLSLGLGWQRQLP